MKPKNRNLLTVAYSVTKPNRISFEDRKKWTTQCKNTSTFSRLVPPSSRNLQVPIRMLPRNWIAYCGFFSRYEGYLSVWVVIYFFELGTKILLPFLARSSPGTLKHLCFSMLDRFQLGQRRSKRWIWGKKKVRKNLGCDLFLMFAVGTIKLFALWVRCVFLIIYYFELNTAWRHDLATFWACP